MYYSIEKMSFISKINSKRYVRIPERSLKKISRLNKKRILTDSSKDQKLVYAFFLEIA